MADKTDGSGRPAVIMRSVRPRIGIAARLQRIEAGLAGIPEVDQSRVQAIRQRLESGAYKVDAQRLAQNLLRYEFS